MKNKIKRLPELAKTIAALKKRGKRIVFTNGCFDLLHLGHVKYLEAARKKGDILIVAINSDASVRRIKGNDRPITDEKHRVGVIAALESVDFVLLFGEDTPLKVIKALKPDILVKGSDWKKKDIVGASFVSSYGGRVSTIRSSQGYSTTAIINKIAKIF